MTAFTVDADTTLLVISTMYEAAESVTTVPTWKPVGGDQVSTLVHEARIGTNAGDMAVATYAIVNPDAETANIQCVHSSNDNGIIVATCYKGTIATSVADAIKSGSEDVNNSATDTTTLSSRGSAGSGLYAAGGFKGGDGSGITTPTNWSEIYDGASGGSSNSDISGYIIDDVDGAPSGVTWTWASSDENSSHLLEIVPAAEGGTINEVTKTDGIAVTSPTDRQRLRRIRSTLDNVETDYSAEAIRKRAVEILDSWIGLQDTVLATKTAAPTVLLSTLNVTDASLAERKLFREQLDNLADVIDLLAILRERNRVLADSIATTDADFQRITRQQTTLDNVSVTDADFQRITRQQQLLDVLAINDASVTLRQRIRTLLSTINVTDAVIATKTGIQVKTLSDAFAVVDNVIAQVIGGDVFFKTVEESFNTVDFISKQIERNRQDSIAATDAQISVKRASRNLLDVIGITDSIDPVTVRLRTTLDSLAATDANVELRQRYRTLLDNIAIVDNVVVISSGVISKTLSDTLSVTDVIEELRQRFRLLVNPSARGTNLFNKSEALYSEFTNVSGGSDSASPIAGFDNSIELPSTNTFARNPGGLVTGPAGDYRISAYVKVDDGAEPVVATSGFGGDFAFTVDNAYADTDPTTEFVSGTVWRCSAMYTSSGAMGNCGVTKALFSSSKVVTFTGLQIENVEGLGDQSMTAYEKVPFPGLGIQDTVHASALRPESFLDAFEVTELLELIRDRNRLLIDNSILTDNAIATRVVGGIIINLKTLIDQLAVNDLTDAEKIFFMSNFIVKHNIEELSVAHDVEILNIVHSVKRET
jgi:hypothetical protein